MRPTKLIAILVVPCAIIFGLLRECTNLIGPEGSANYWCLKTEYPSSTNIEGLIVSAHELSCDTLGNDSNVYVYLRRESEAENSRTLIMRYADPPNSKPPQFTWQGNSPLQISIGDVDAIVKKVVQASGVKISYVVGKESFPDTNRQ
jgi:hypothetical protein